MITAMSLPPNLGLAAATLFTLDPTQTGGRKNRIGLEIQDQYVAATLTRFLVGPENFLVARIEGVEDLEVFIGISGGWVERYYQIKTRQEGSNRWTILGLEKEGIWTRFFALYRMFVMQQTSVSRSVEFVIALEGDLDSELVELRDKGPAASSARAKLLRILAESVAREAFPPGASIQSLVSGMLDNFIRTVKFDSRVANLRDVSIKNLLESGDLSPDEARQAFERLMISIKNECLRSQPTAITTLVLRDWIGFPERAILQNKPVPDPDEIQRDQLLQKMTGVFERTSVVLLYGTPKIGKSHFVSALVDHTSKTNDYFWFTFSGTDRDKDAFAFQLALWIGQRTSIWQITDDIRRGHLLPEEALIRFREIPIGAVYLVLDDCHKARDRAFLEKVALSVNGGWSDAKVIFISEQKIPELAAIGTEEHRIAGLDTKEAILFLMRRGIDARYAAAEIGILCFQADGHPALLRAIATELPSRPSPADVTSLSASLMSAKAAQPFLRVISERLLRSLSVEVHRQWLERLAVLAFSFRRDLAVEIARLEPAINVAAADWNVLVSLILDQTGADQYLVPVLFRPLLKFEQAAPTADAILVASARYAFRTARTSSRIDFWDFHSAIVALVTAQQYDEAAYHFIVSIVGSRGHLPIDLLELLFMLLNGEIIHEKLDAPTRFTLLTIEVSTRLLSDATPSPSTILRLFRRIRLTLKQQPLARVAYAKAMVHMLVALARTRQIKEKGTIKAKLRARAFTSAEAALRISLDQDDSHLIENLLGSYEHFYFMAHRPDLELLKRAILRQPNKPAIPSLNCLISIYTQFGLIKNWDDRAMAMYEGHSQAYRAASRPEAFFAAEHGSASILMERFRQYDGARMKIAQASAHAFEAGASAEVIGRTDLFIADSYWAEENYACSAAYYLRSLDFDLGDDTLTQWAREKAADSLIASGLFEESAMLLTRTLRRDHRRLSPVLEARLYARLAYAYAEGNSLKKAAIACLKLCRIAGSSDSVEIDRLSTIVSGWVLQHLKYTDPAIPPVDMKIRDSAALSEASSADELAKWASEGPPQSRGLMLVGSIFELLGYFGRSESLYRRASLLAKQDEDQNRLQLAGYIYEMRIARVQIRRHKFGAASESLRIFVEGLSKRGAPPDRVLDHPGVAAYVAMRYVEPCLESCSDSEVTKFLPDLESRFVTWPEARAWLLYAQSHILFKRLLVQAARRTLLAAEDLVRASDEYELLWSVLHSKLFVYMEQVYRTPDQWFTDVLETCVLLARDDRLAKKRSDFASGVAAITARYVSPLGDVGQIILRLSARVEDRFWLTMLAVWKVAKVKRFAVSRLVQVEEVLRQSKAIPIEELT